MPMNLCLEVIDNTTFKVNEIEEAGATNIVALWGTNNEIPAGPTPTSTTGEFTVLGTTFTATGTAGTYSVSNNIQDFAEPLPNNVNDICAINDGYDMYLGLLNEFGVPFLAYYKDINNTNKSIIGGGIDEVTFETNSMPSVSEQQCNNPDYALTATDVFVDTTDTPIFKNKIELRQVLSCSVVGGESLPVGNIMLGVNPVTLYGENIKTSNIINLSS